MSAPRQRKGKGGQAEGGSPRKGEEAAPPPTPEPRSSSPPRAPAASPSRGPHVLLWLLFLLLAGGLGALGWLHLKQQEGLQGLGQELQDLQNRVPMEMENLRVYLLREQERKSRVSDTEDIEERIMQLEDDWEITKKQLDQATTTLVNALTVETFDKVSAIQADVKKNINDIRLALPSASDLMRLEHQMELIKSAHVEKLKRDVMTVLSDLSGMKDNMTALTAWFSSAAGTMQENGQSVMTLRQDMGAVSDSFEAALDFLAQRVDALEGGFNQTSQAVEGLESKLERCREELITLREVAASQRQDQVLDSQQLESIREVIKQLGEEKSQTAEEVISIRHSLADQKRETKNEVSEMSAALSLLQARLAQVEMGATNQNIKVSEAVDQELQSLKKGLHKVEGGIQQCLSGDVQTYCETADNCGWPHLREVNFPHRVLTKPTITLGVSGLSAQGSVGISVKAIDVTDSGFKIEISNVGNHHLSSIRVTWMLCA